MLTALRRTAALGLAAALFSATTACDLFDVTNPGPIIDEALEEESSGNTVLIGAIADVEVALDDYAYFAGVASTDLNADATRPWVQNPGEGRLNIVDAENQWDSGQRALWVTEAAIERLERTQTNPGQSPLVAAAYLWAGWANRIVGDNVCTAIFDGGEPQDPDQHYVRAIERFGTARSMASAIGGLDSIRVAAIAGMAQSNLMLGNYAEAASLAAEVPDDFTWVGHRSENTPRENNQIWSETFDQKQVTVWNTYTDSVGPDADPRIPWVDMEILSASGNLPFHRQLKYSSRGSDIPLAKGREMRLIEAEVALRGGDVEEAMAKINYVRGLVGVDPVSATTEAEAWLALDRERNFELWLEGRRLKDNVRFWEEGLSSWAVAFIEGGGQGEGPRDTCFPPSQGEINTNPNLSGWPP